MIGASLLVRCTAKLSQVLAGLQMGLEECACSLAHGAS